jgi:hypothetical protein
MVANQISELVGGGKRFITSLIQAIAVTLSAENVFLDVADLNARSEPLATLVKHRIGHEESAERTFAVVFPNELALCRRERIPFVI